MRSDFGGPSLGLPAAMKFGEGSQSHKGFAIDVAASFANTAEQAIPRCAEESISPAGVLFAGVALFPLKYPLQRIIDEPPVRVQLRYEAI